MSLRGGDKSSERTGQFNGSLIDKKLDSEKEDIKVSLGSTDDY